MSKLLVLLPELPQIRPQLFLLLQQQETKGPIRYPSQVPNPVRAMMGAAAAGAIDNNSATSIAAANSNNDRTARRD